MSITVDGLQRISTLNYFGWEIVEVPNLVCVVGIAQSLANGLCERYDDGKIDDLIKFENIVNNTN
jgi:hypothetical protein